MPQEPETLDWALLTRYLTGELSPAEMAAVERWFDADPAHREALDELRAVWMATGSQTEGWGTDRAIADLRRKALGDADRRAFTLPRSAEKVASPQFAFRQRRSWLAIAAGLGAVALGLGAGAMALKSKLRHTAAPAVATVPATDIVAPRGQQAEVRLADGTRVILGAASRLTYANDFGQRERTVVLEGEAYFDVAHDRAKPFRVRTATGVAEDIGTAFVVRARGASPLQVVVAEGIVMLRGPSGDDRADSLRLTRGQLGRIRADGRFEFRPTVDADAYLAWTQGQLVFEDTPLAEVAEELSRWYDVDVRVADSALVGRRFSGRFSRRSIEEAVRLVATVADVSVRPTSAGWLFK